MSDKRVDEAKERSKDEGQVKIKKDSLRTTLEKELGNEGDNAPMIEDFCGRN